MAVEDVFSPHLTGFLYYDDPPTGVSTSLATTIEVVHAFFYDQADLSTSRDFPVIVSADSSTSPAIAPVTSASQVPTL